MSEADIGRYIERMNVVRDGENRLAAALQRLDQDVDLTVPIEADTAMTSVRQQ